MRVHHLKTGWLWVFGVGLSLIFTGWTPAAEPQAQTKAAVAEKPAAKKPLLPFTISKATTRITEPLKPDGTVDFAAALNARRSQGLSPENNAGVLLMQAFGKNAVPEANREKFYKFLGVPVPEANEGSLKNFGQIVNQHLRAKGEDIEQDHQPFWDQQNQAMSRPWSRKEFPLIATWVDANAAALTLAVQASQKPRLFIPLVAPENESLLNASLEGVQRMRSIARLLAARAMLALHEGRVEEAQTDLLACHRLASLLGHQSTMIEALVSYALDALACRADLAFTQSEKISQAQLAAYRQKLANLPALPNMSECIDQGERFFSLDAISNLATNQDEEYGQSESDSTMPNLWQTEAGACPSIGI